ncbi:diaminopimelate decarboxylase [Streptomyces sp. NPDC040750]|uniref:diaminopimelate decarboxylase n=1 Tax=Streptomyces sp. NPDC040750 TaxID=3154491 RepID=UPI0033C3BC03
MTEVSSVEELKFLAPQEVREIALRYGTPVFVYDEESITTAADRMSGLPNSFGLTVRYSLKACPSQAVIRLLGRQGLAFDASSVWEVRRAVLAGITPDRIMLTAQQVVFDEEMMGLLDSGLVFDAGSLDQLEAYGSRYPGRSVSLRINPGFGSGLVRRLTSGGPDSSFGIWHEDIGEVKRLLQHHQLKLTRLHSHIGSGHHWDVLVQAFRELLTYARQFSDVSVIDLGGGYRTQSLLTDPVQDHHAWAEVVASDLREFAEETGRQLKLEIEPGTYIMANSGSIITRVTEVVSTGNGGHRFIKIDGGLTEIIRPSYYGAPHPLVSVAAHDDAVAAHEDACEDSAGYDDYCVAGHCCIAGDMLTVKPGAVEELAPVRLRRTTPGDLLVIERGGAYTASMALKNFNSYPEAPEVLRRSDGRYDLIRARQSLEQIVANERVPDDL